MRGFGQWIAFVAAGLCGLAVDLIGMSLLLAVGAPAVVARVLTLGAGLIATYSVNRTLTFRGTGKIVSEFGRYLIASAAGVTMNWLLFTAMVQGARVDPLVAICIATAVMIVPNFLLYKRLVFRATRPDPVRRS